MLSAMSRCPYLPFSDGPHRLAMGLLTLKPEDWIEIDEDYVEYLTEKRRLLADRREEVFWVSRPAEEACVELRDVLIEHLKARFPVSFRQRGTELTNLLTEETWNLLVAELPPLELASRLVQEDFCVLQADSEGRYRLTAASVCFPTRWILGEKLGRPMLEIHAPVPGYAETLGRPVDRFFSLLKVDKPVWRLNWSLTDSPNLFQPTRPASVKITLENAGQNVYLRVERQTLRRLPVSGAIAFGIRIYQTPLARIAEHPETAARLAAAIRAMPAETLSYKSLDDSAPAIIDFLMGAALSPTGTV